MSLSGACQLRRASQLQFRQRDVIDVVMTSGSFWGCLRDGANLPSYCFFGSVSVCGGRALGLRKEQETDEAIAIPHP